VSPQLSKRLWTKVSRTGNVCECWLWTGAITSAGYGSIYAGNRRVASAHRVTYEETFGPIPAGLQIDHLCRDRRCVNPWHLEPVTASENISRSPLRFDKYRSRTTCKNGHRIGPGDTYITPQGHRKCRACGRSNDRVRYAFVKARREVDGK